MTEVDVVSVSARCECCEKSIPEGQEIVHPDEGDSYCARCVVDLIGAERDDLQRRLQGAVDAMYQIAEQAGLIDCDYDLIARLLEEHGDGRDRFRGQ